MSELNTIARPYAQAAFDLAKEADALEKWSDMLGFAAIVSADATMRQAIDSPNLSVAEQAELFIQVCDDQLDDQGRNFVKLLAENRRLTLFTEIAALYEELRADAEGTLEATVISAKPMSDAQQQEMADALKERFNRDVVLLVEVDESMVGGAIIRAGDTVIDGSVRGKLEQFAHALI